MWIVDSNPAFCGIAEPVGQYFYVYAGTVPREKREERGTGTNLYCSGTIGT